jgi:hypothetical protein
VPHYAEVNCGSIRDQQELARKMEDDVRSLEAAAMARQVAMSDERSANRGSRDDGNEEEEDDDEDDANGGGSAWEGRDAGGGEDVMSQLKNRRRRRLTGSPGTDGSARPGRDPSAFARTTANNDDDDDDDAAVSIRLANAAGSVNLRPVFGKEEFKEVIQLAVPALGSLLADPLMSLVDTAVGLLHKL